MGQFCFLLRYLQQPQKTFRVVVSGCGATSTPQRTRLNELSKSKEHEDVSLVHDALQDGGKRCDADACPNQDGMLRSKDLSGRSPIRSIYITLKCTDS